MRDCRYPGELEGGGEGKANGGPKAWRPQAEEPEISPPRKPGLTISPLSIKIIANITTITTVIIA